MINLSKAGLVDLGKQVEIVVEKLDLGDHKAAVVFVADISSSTQSLYANKHMQKVTDEVFVVAVKFDNDGDVPLALMETKTHDVGAMTVENYVGFLDKKRAGKSGGTKYLPAIDWVYEKASTKKKKLFGRKTTSVTPTFAVILTDGVPQDSLTKIKEKLDEIDSKPLYICWIGVGKDFFPVLEEIVQGHSNMHTVIVKEPNSIKSEDMFELLLTPYKKWLLSNGYN